MQVSCPNNVKIYNLSAGKSLPEVKASTTVYLIFGLISVILTFVFIPSVVVRTQKTKIIKEKCR